ncbi:MAG: DUF2934 domain-containing protein [Rhizobiaceae bacterium]|jgi:hypothetical protein|nr:DUF2934 domain-containing protein [Rhizobiaceae bacterium]
MAAKAKPQTKSAGSITDELIREIAHRLWVEEGQPEGRADDHWFKAQEIAHAKKVIAAKKAAAKIAGAKVEGAKPAARKAKKAA